MLLLVSGAVWMCTETLLRVRNSKHANNGHDQTIKNALQARSSDQDRILDDQDFDLARGQSIPQDSLLGDYPLYQQ